MGELYYKCFVVTNESDSEELVTVIFILHSFVQEGICKFLLAISTSTLKIELDDMLSMVESCVSITPSQIMMRPFSKRKIHIHYLPTRVIEVQQL